MNIYHIWYSTDDGECDFAECRATSEQEAKEWFRFHFNERIDSVEKSEYELLND